MFENFTVLISDGARNSYENVPDHDYNHQTTNVRSYANVPDHDYDRQTTNVKILSQKYLSSNTESNSESHPEPVTKVQLEHISQDGL